MSKTQRAKLGTTGVFNTKEPDAPAPTEQKRPDRVGRTAMPFWVPVAARKQLRMLAAELDSTQQHLMTEALNMLFQKHHKPPIA